MRIIKLAIGNNEEAFIEERFNTGINIISSDDNNRGKTIVIQSILYALGNEPTFPITFDYKNYYYYVEFEVKDVLFSICRFNDEFLLKSGDSIMMFDNVSELKRYWNKKIFTLPEINKNGLIRIVDPVLFFQLFFVGQDKKDTSNINHHGFYNKQDFYEMLYSMNNISGNELNDDDIDTIKRKIKELTEKRQLLLKENKILKSNSTPITYLSTTSDRLAFQEKIKKLAMVHDKIAELRKQRNSSVTRKNKWEATLKELRSLNRTIQTGSLRCMDCNSTNIAFVTGENSKNSYTFDVSTVEMRSNIIKSIEEKISAYTEEIESISNKINNVQIELQSLMAEEDISIESLVLLKKDMISVTDTDKKITDIDNQISELKNQLIHTKNINSNIIQQQKSLINSIIERMNILYKQIDQNGNLRITSLFTTKDEVYSGSEATIFHIVKLLALQYVLAHNYPIIIDSFRAEDLSTAKESIVLGLMNNMNNQFICTTTLKKEEMGKYDNNTTINHIDYKDNQPSKILSKNYVEDFQKLLKPFAIEFEK